MPEERQPMNALKRTTLTGLLGALSFGPGLSPNACLSLAAQLPSVSLSTARTDEGVVSEPKSQLAPAVATPRDAHPVGTASVVVTASPLPPLDTRLADATDNLCVRLTTLCSRAAR